MSTTLALEAQRMVRRAAEPIRPGDSIKGQLRRAERALGYGDGERWRVRAAWYGEASNWSATAFEELRTRFAAWDKRNAARAQAEVEKLTALYEALRVTDAEFFGDHLSALGDVLRKLGAKTAE